MIGTAAVAVGQGPCTVASPPLLIPDMLTHGALSLSSLQKTLFASHDGSFRSAHRKLGKLGSSISILQLRKLRLREVR